MAKTIAGTYLDFRNKMINWERRLRAANDADVGHEVANEIGKYIDDDYGGREFAIYIKKIQDIAGPSLN